MLRLSKELIYFRACLEEGWKSWVVWTRDKMEVWTWWVDKRRLIKWSDNRILLGEGCFRDIRGPGGLRCVCACVWLQLQNRWDGLSLPLSLVSLELGCNSSLPQMSSSFCPSYKKMPQTHKFLFVANWGKCQGVLGSKLFYLLLFLLIALPSGALLLIFIPLQNGGRTER